MWTENMADLAAADSRMTQIHGVFFRTNTRTFAILLLLERKSSHARSGAHPPHERRKHLAPSRYHRVMALTSPPITAGHR